MINPHGCGLKELVWRPDSPSDHHTATLAAKKQDKFRRANRRQIKKVRTVMSEHTCFVLAQPCGIHNRQPALL